MRGLGRTLAFLLLLASGCAEEGGGSDGGSGASGRRSPPAREELPAVTINSSGGEKVEVRVEVADNEAERALGLMYRTALGENRGMLFVFPDEEVRSFWMKNTLIPLSIAYIDSEGRIVDIQNMKALDDEPPNYTSAKPARYALEVNRGFFKERGVEVGDRAELPG